jgi:hypothetical protein
LDRAPKYFKHKPYHDALPLIAYRHARLRASRRTSLHVNRVVGRAAAATFRFTALFKYRSLDVDVSQVDKPTPLPKRCLNLRITNREALGHRAAVVPENRYALGNAVRLAMMSLNASPAALLYRDVATRLVLSCSFEPRRLSST